MIQDGYYKARATGRVNMGYSANDVRGIGVECDIIDNDGTILGQMTSWMYFTANTLEMNAQRLRALGVVGDDLSVEPIPGLGSVLAQCQVKTETYEGKQRQKLEIKTSGGAVFKHEMDEAGRRKFAAQFRSYLAKAPVVAGATAAGQAKLPAQRQAAPASDFGAPANGARRQQQPPPDAGDAYEPGPDDDIPF